jgi:hypothetical protein
MHPKFTIWLKRGTDAPWLWYLSTTDEDVAIRGFTAIKAQYPPDEYPQHKAVLCQGSASDTTLPYRMREGDIIEVYPAGTSHLF